MGGRQALLIGIDDCWIDGWDSLKYAESDCQKLGAALCQERFGFSKDNIRTLTGRNDEHGNQPFRNNLIYDGLFSPYMHEDRDKLDLFFLYFAGHGVDYKGESYLVPADGVRDRIPETCVSWQHILERMSQVHARHKLVLLDICRKSPSSVGGPSSRLEPSFTVPASNVRGVLILSACDVGEFAHECTKLGGGVYTHYWSEGLKGVVRGELNAASLTALEVHTYAESKTVEWVKKNSSEVKSVQTPTTLVANCSTIYLEQDDGGVAALPPDVSDRAARTQIIVKVADRILEKLKHSPGDYCIRIRAALSSFAITENEVEEGASGNQENYRALLLEERQKLDALFRAGASLKLLLSWNLSTYLALKRVSSGTMLERMQRLKSFLEEILRDDKMLSRTAVVHTPIHDRNLLFLGTDYFFEGRRLGMASGFDVTEIISGTGEIQRKAIKREIELFDASFEDASRWYCITHNLRAGTSRNAEMIGQVIKDLKDDIERAKDEAAG